MKLRHLLLSIALLAAVPATPGSAATVLSNLPSAVSTNQGIKGPGGAFIPIPISYGFEFTVAGGDYLLDYITLDFGSTLGSKPLVVEVYSSPTGPDTASLIAALDGPASPTNGQFTWTPFSALPLTDGGTYFVKLSVPVGPAQYILSRSSTPLAGPWTFNAAYTKPGSSAWLLSGGDEPLMKMGATAVPEPGAVSALLAGLSLLLITRRRM